MAEAKTLLISADTMQKTFKKILIDLKFPKKIATENAKIFTENSIDGIYTHGVNRFPRFIQYIKDGYIKPSAKPKRKHKFGGIEQWDGKLGPGPTNASFATERVMKLAKKHGIGCVALANTNHWMRGGAFGWQAAKEGFAFISWTNTLAVMPAWGAKDAKIGNNPLVFGLPFHEEAVVLDMAMSQFSFGAMDLAVKKGVKLPVVGGFDTKGKITDDPAEILESWRPLPIGYWKGAGLSFLLDLMAAILSDGLSVHKVSQQPAEIASSQIFIAIDLKKLPNHSIVSKTIQEIIDDLKTSIPADKNAKISYPGERVLETRAKNLSEGIPVLKSVWNEIIG